MVDSVNIEIHINTKKPRPPGVFAQVKNHVEMFGENILEYTNVPERFGGIPSVFQLISTAQTRPVTMTRELQEWAFGLMLETAPHYMSRADVKKAYANAYMGSKAFTNGSGWDTQPDGGGLVYADWILETGLDNPEGWKLQNTICHGATVKVLRTFSKAGIVQAAIECLDAYNADTLTKTYKDSPWLIFPAVNWSRYPLPYGHGEPFPKLDGADVPIPLLGYHTTEAYIDNSWLRYLSDDEPFPANPYWKVV